MNLLAHYNNDKRQINMGIFKRLQSHSVVSNSTNICTIIIVSGVMNVWLPPHYTKWNWIATFPFFVTIQRRIYDCINYTDFTFFWIWSQGLLVHSLAQHRTAAATQDGEAIAKKTSDFENCSSENKSNINYFSTGVYFHAIDEVDERN